MESKTKQHVVMCKCKLGNAVLFGTPDGKKFAQVRPLYLLERYVRFVGVSCACEATVDRRSKLPDQSPLASIVVKNDKSRAWNDKCVKLGTPEMLRWEWSKPL